jgi:hypothetical protein
MTTTVYRGHVSGERYDGTRLVSIDEATTTGVELDGCEIVNFYGTYVPAAGWCGSRTEAKQQIVDKLIEKAGILQAQIDRLKDEIVHECLTTEAAA